MNTMNTIEEITAGIKEWLKVGNGKRQCFCFMIDDDSKEVYRMMKGKYYSLAITLAAAASNDANINTIINDACLIVKIYKDEKELK